MDRLIHSLPESASLPDMTARWETELNAISQRQRGYNGFMQPLLTSLQALIAQSKATLPEGLKNIEAKPSPKKKRRSGKTPRKAANPRRTKRNARPRSPG